MEPLRQEWARVQATAERLKEEKRATEAKAAVQAFHDKLCATRVLDPACGTGNFLYVALELMKRLEGEVLEALVDLGGQEALKGMEGHTIDPHQFLGIEKNPRAAAIAELVIWLGYLQWHYRTKGGDPSEPILRDFKNITVMDAVLTWDGYPVPGVGGGVRKARGNLSQRAPSRLARGGVHRRQSTVHWRQGHPPAVGRGVRRDALARAQPNQRQRRLRHVLVGPRRGDRRRA
jgi:hypothetical protein